MSDQQTAVRPARSNRGRVRRVVRGVGWTLIATGVVILLYLVYLLFFTNLQTEQAQDELLDQWQLEVEGDDATLPGEGDDGPAEAVDPGDAYAAMWFERDGERIIHDEVLYVVEGTSVADLRRGPGHYADTAAPGADGNFAVSGHRTTYGAPFFHLDRLQEGDRIHVVDRRNREWVYEFRARRIVAPSDVWVISEDPLDDGAPLLTLTTCHPRFSDAQRLIVFADLVGDPRSEDPAADEAAA